MKVKIETEYDPNDPSKRAMIFHGEVPPHRDARGLVIDLRCLAANTHGHRYYDVFLDGSLVDMMRLRYADASIGLIVLLVLEQPQDGGKPVRYAMTPYKATAEGSMRRMFQSEILYGRVEIKLRPEE